MRIIRYFIISVFISAALQAYAQVVIAPPLVVVDQSRPYGDFMVINQSDRAQEISISFVYAYPVSDSAGTVSMNYVDDPGEEYPSAVGLIRAFPRRFILQPFQEQTVRLTVRQRGALADGTYTARIVTSSTPQTADVVASQEGVTAQVNFVFNQVSAFLYKHGSVSTGVHIQNVSADTDSAGRNIYVSLVRTGNSPFLGTANLKIYDSGGTVIQSRQVPVAVYFDLTRRFSFGNDELPSGVYTVEVILTTEGRSDIPREHLIQTKDVSIRETITIQP